MQCPKNATLQLLILIAKFTRFMKNIQRDTRHLQLSKIETNPSFSCQISMQKQEVRTIKIRLTFYHHKLALLPSGYEAGSPYETLRVYIWRQLFSASSEWQWNVVRDICVINICVALQNESNFSPFSIIIHDTEKSEKAQWSMIKA